ncbi:hypothetical protein LCGC14_0467060, partial [marine sediment metagenome]
VKCKHLYICGQVKPYSTDIATAMTLLPDIIKAGYHIAICQSLDRKSTSVSIVYCTQIIMQEQGIDIDKVLAKAISGAWLKWKENA